MIVASSGGYPFIVTSGSGYSFSFTHTHRQACGTSLISGDGRTGRKEGRSLQKAEQLKIKRTERF